MHFGVADQEALEKVKILVVFGRLYLLLYFLLPVKVENISNDKTSVQALYCAGDLCGALEAAEGGMAELGSDFHSA